MVMIGVAFKIHAFLPVMAILAFHVIMLSLGAWTIIQRNNSSRAPAFVFPFSSVAVAKTTFIFLSGVVV